MPPVAAQLFSTHYRIPDIRSRARQPASRRVRPAAISAAYDKNVSQFDRAEKKFG